jgi:hypothetical protein
MSDYRESLADAHGVMALLEAEARGQREITALRLALYLIYGV